MRYAVSVGGLEDLAAQQTQVVFHGVNKSGSLVMTTLLHEAYRHHARANQFFSTYVSVPRQLDLLTDIVEHSSGHAFFGAHYLYGAVDLTPTSRRMVTQFRNPLPRARSCYQWLSNKAQEQGRDYPGFEQWLVATKGTAHSQVRQFGVGYAPGHEAVERSANPEELFERSVQAIERDVSWFGIAEYLEESAFCLAALCGLSSIEAWTRDDRNVGRPLVDDWAPGEADLVREVYRWDFALYDWALETFRKRVAELDFGPDLEAYREACRGEYKDRLGSTGSPAPPLETGGSTRRSGGRLRSLLRRRS